MWVLGGKLESSARTARTLIPGAIPPALKLHFLNLHGEHKCRPCLFKNRRPISGDLRAHVLMRFPPFSPRIVNISTKHLCNYNRRQIYIEPYRGSYGNKVKNTNIALFMILFCQNWYLHTACYGPGCAECFLLPSRRRSLCRDLSPENNGRSWQWETVPQ